MKRKIFITIGIILFILLCALGLNYIDNYDEIYYTKIDNTNIEKLSGEDMKYEYTLTSYNKHGHKKTLKFKTVRILKEDAYLSLEVKTFGVHKWEEVTFESLPTKVKEKFE